MVAQPSEADRHANPHYTIQVNIKFTEGAGPVRNSRDMMAVTTSDTSKNAAIRRAISMLGIELSEDKPIPAKATARPWDHSLETR